MMWPIITIQHFSLFIVFCLICLKLSALFSVGLVADDFSFSLHLIFICMSAVEPCIFYEIGTQEI